MAASNALLVPPRYCWDQTPFRTVAARLGPSTSPAVRLWSAFHVVKDWTAPFRRAFRLCGQARPGRGKLEPHKIQEPFPLMSNLSKHGETCSDKIFFTTFQFQTPKDCLHRGSNSFLVRTKLAEILLSWLPERMMLLVAIGVPSQARKSEEVIPINSERVRDMRRVSVARRFFRLCDSLQVTRIQSGYFATISDPLKVFRCRPGPSTWCIGGTPGPFHSLQGLLC